MTSVRMNEIKRLILALYLSSAPIILIFVKAASYISKWLSLYILIITIISEFYFSLELIIDEKREIQQNIKKIRESNLDDYKVFIFGEEKNTLLEMTIPENSFSIIFTMSEKNQFLDAETWEEMKMLVTYIFSNDISNKGLYIIKFNIPEDKINYKKLKKYKAEIGYTQYVIN